MPSKYNLINFSSCFGRGEMGEEVEKYYFDSKKMKSKGIYMCRVEG
jgi:hypothetical protein